ncbi:La-related protein 6 [Oryzias melastigma]|uniref:La-related protein 6 n=1 Tax=Oryzias melastigma TaxID=30732 RepID=A0A834FH50_ORYME|nr:La-related protein 6 [Oryzias melastigma]
MCRRDGVQTGCGDGLLLKIRARLEEMFTDAHLAEDGFLLKHLQSRNGFVSLKLLTCLKKVAFSGLLSSCMNENEAESLRLLQIKTLTPDWHVTLEAALSSDLLEVNDERTKLRRKRPLPQWLLCSPTSKLLLICNAAEEQSRRAEHHSLLQTLAPEELPKELQCYTKRHQELGQHACTVVKFDLLEKVRRAFRDLQGEGLRVVALGCKSMCNFQQTSTQGGDKHATR